MTSRSTGKRRMVGAVVLCSAVLALTGARSDGASEMPVPAAAPVVRVRVAKVERDVPVAPAQSTLELPQRSEPAADDVNLFSRHSWYVAPPPPPPPPPTESTKPTAPPLPFTFMGMYAEGGGATVYFLQQGDRVHDVRPGDVIDGTYAVIGETGGQLMLKYLPLEQQQGLQVGTAP